MYIETYHTQAGEKLNGIWNPRKWLDIKNDSVPWDKTKTNDAR